MVHLISKDHAKKRLGWEGTLSMEVHGTLGIKSDIPIKVMVDHKAPPMVDHRSPLRVTIAVYH
jgi:hypothetical protein